MVGVKKSRPILSNSYTIIGSIVLAAIGGFWLSRLILMSSKNPVSTITQQTVPTQVLAKHKGWVYTVAISPDGETLASGSYDGTIKITNISNGELLHNIKAHDDAIESLAISPDGKILASGSWDNHIKLWDLSNGNLVRDLNSHTDDVKAIAFSVDSQTLASGSYDGMVKIWNIKTGSINRSLKHPNILTSLALSQDGKMLATAGRNGIIKTWDLNTGKEQHSIAAHKKTIMTLAFSPNNQMLASGSRDRTVKLWQVDSGKLYETLEKEKAVFSVAFSADSKTLATSSHKRDISLWQVNTGELIKKLTAHSKAVFSVQFNPDGQTLVSGSADGTVKLWSMQTSDQQLEDIDIAVEPSAVKEKAFSSIEKAVLNVNPEIPDVDKVVFNVNPEIPDVEKAVPSVNPEVSEGASKITDVAMLKKLNQNLYNKIDQSWRQTPTWYEDLVFQMKVNADNVIIGLEPMNQEARDYAGQTPLPKLLHSSNSGEKQSFGVFRVVMTPTGVLEVSPWEGWLSFQSEISSQ
ncbi:MAG: WD40 repeat domain-containing protein [Okeania sp. SIO3I5]|nr:WD40 repeat domain-containing protein [Okeania sp. SIO3I5]